MTVTIPSTTVRNRFLKTLPIGTIYKDPRNEHHYEVQERKINTTLSKVGVPYFGSNQPLVIDVPEKWMKMVNPVRDKIKKLMNDKEYFETDSELFFVDNTLVYYLRKKSSGDNKKRIQRIKHDLMKGDTNLCKELQ
ncbi:hypothetical protein CcCBS67573_g08562 [Chytriomyces confervae]|uniref:Uncharacterized protein n=1 Tax=Chytriomyces confervae TaxID=246404 RepID=A0A507EJ87_9FUNG|nr:hypothetical protein CcCBS67573_g08562 [Chytriomyces confervae]